MFLTLCSVNLQDSIVWLRLLLEISDKMCIVIICFSVDEILNFEINISCLFLHAPKNKDKRLNILRTKAAFKMK